jgi:hypothetical protein
MLSHDFCSEQDYLEKTNISEVEESEDELEESDSNKSE